MSGERTGATPPPPPRGTAVLVPSQVTPPDVAAGRRTVFGETRWGPEGVRLFPYVPNQMPTRPAEVVFLRFAVGNFSRICASYLKVSLDSATGPNVNEVKPDGSAQRRAAHCDNELYN